MARANLLTVLLVAAAMSACGGGTPPADSPDDASADTASDMGSEAGDTPAEKPRDGIVRDADGDGVPDDGGSGCDGKNETQCKINSSCAWTDDGKCVEAQSSPM